VWQGFCADGERAIEVSGLELAVFHRFLLGAFLRLANHGEKGKP
jgi:hypothetical protein